MSEASESSSGEMNEGNAQPMPAETGSPADPMNSANSPMESQSSPTTSTPEERQNQVQQARAELAGRRQPIDADKQAAEQIAQLLDNIDNSGAKIQELSEQLMANNQAAENATQPMGEGEPSKPENGEGSQPMPSESSSGDVDPSNTTGEASGEAPADQETQPNPIASQLAESMRQFANSQREATQLAANTAQQNQIANQPVRDALQTASRLPVPMSQMNQPAEGNSGDEAAAEGTAPSSDAEGQPGDTTQEPGSPADGSPMGSTPSEPSSNPTQSGTLASQESPNQQPSGEMGNSMVSPTPQVTAQALAGMEAMESLWDQMPELIADGDPSNSNEVATIDPLGMAAPASAMLDNPSECENAYGKLRDELAKVIVGQSDVIEQVLVAMFARGHALLEGVPGLAKTLLVSSLAESLHLSFKRIQFTPDLMPSDITGTEIIQEDLESKKRRYEFLEGPIFANLILADEINRTPPKTQ
ncbi:unnamed protein product, partial [Symbiodinium sp. CCMP2456]